MARRNLGRLRPGELIRADYLNGLADAIEAGANIQVGGGLRQVSNVGGNVIALDDAQPILARIVARGTGAVYSWQEVYPGNTPGAFPDGYLIGTTSVAYAIEQNGNTAVPIGTRVTLYPIGGGRYRFQIGSCSPNSQAGTRPPVPPPPPAPQITAAVAHAQTSAQAAAQLSSLTPYTGTAIGPPMPGL